MKIKAQMQQSQKQSPIQYKKAYWVTEPKEEINTLEQVVVISLYVKWLELGSIPLCLEHDGFLLLTNSLNALQECRRTILDISKQLIGVEVDLESKDPYLDLS